jgi:hypothetical protein
MGILLRHLPDVNQHTILSFHVRPPLLGNRQPPRILAAPKRAGALGASVHSRDRHVRSSVVLFRARGCLALQSKMLQLFQRRAAVFDPEEITIIATAFDDAWERLEKSGYGSASAKAKERARQQLAKRIIDMAKLGERDPHKLCEDALLFMAQANRCPNRE